MRIVKLAPIIWVLLFVLSCSNNLFIETPDNIIEENDVLLLKDNERNIAVFVDEDSVSLDITSFDEELGRDVKCVEPLDFRLLNNEDFSRSGASFNNVKVIILGMRDDGNPGIWLINRDQTVYSPLNEESGKKSSRLYHISNTGDELIGGEYQAYLGWKYYPTLLSDDGKIVGGYAYNEDGFNSYFINIDKEKKAAVYWSLRENNHGQYYISRARVVGTLPESENNGNRDWRWLRRIISRLKLLFLDYLDNYLIEPESIVKNEIDQFYSMTGFDQDNDKAVAIISRNKVKSITKIKEENNDPNPLVSPTLVYDISPGTNSIQTFQLVCGDNIENEFLYDVDGDEVTVVLDPLTPLPSFITFDEKTGEVSIDNNYAPGSGSVKLNFWTIDDRGGSTEDDALSVTIQFLSS